VREGAPGKRLDPSPAGMVRNKMPVTKQNTGRVVAALPGASGIIFLMPN